MSSIAQAPSRRLAQRRDRRPPAGPSGPLAEQDRDADLIALCSEAENCEERIREIDRDRGSDTPGERNRKSLDAWIDARKKVADLPAVTLAGIRAKARVVKRALIREYFWSDGGGYCDPDEVEAADVRTDAEMALFLCHDLIRLGAAA